MGPAWTKYESDTTNNCSPTVTVLGLPLPDLVCHAHVGGRGSATLATVRNLVIDSPGQSGGQLGIPLAGKSLPFHT